MKRVLPISIFLIAFAFLISCHKEGNLEAEKKAIMRVIARDTVWFNVNTEVDSTDTTMIAVNDTLLIWWRGQQTHSAPIISIEINGDSAFVSWARKNTGPFYLLIKPPDTTWLLWTKAVSETAKIRAVFRKTGDVNDTITRGWQLKKISLAWGQSDSVQTVRIDSLRIQSPSHPNLLITNPLETFFPLDSLISFSPGELVTLTLYTNASDACAFLHTFILIWPFYVRIPFTNLGNGVFTGTWHAQIIPFPRYAFFDFLHHATLFTPDYKYDFNGWLLPYQIK
uniref:Uncharacterized protein n=1 Tax=candidate division WOR-3 bacterium TaxID=2052148 RepID=A0A7C3Z1B6_UNCW3